MTKDEFMRKMRDLVLEYEESCDQIVGVILTTFEGDAQFSHQWSGNHWLEINPSLEISLTQRTRTDEQG